MIKKSKKIIVSLLMALTLVSVLPCTQTLANSKDGVQQKYTKVNGKITFQYFLNGELLTNQWYEYDVPLASIDKDGNKTLFDDHHKIYLDENGCQAHGWRVIDGNTYYLGDSPFKGEKSIKGSSGKYEKYVFDDDGKLITDPVKVKYSGKEYTIADDDKSVTIKVDGVEYNVPKNESLANDNIVEKDGKYYSAARDSNYAGVYHIKKSSEWKDYYAKENGTLATNEWIYVKEPDRWNYDSKMYVEDYSWKYYGPDMKNVKGYQTINGKKYYFGTQGSLMTGWKWRKADENLSGTEKNMIWSYYGQDGSIKEGWINSRGKWYYIYSDGLMATNTTTPDGYFVNSKGIWK